MIFFTKNPNQKEKKKFFAGEGEGGGGGGWGEEVGDGMDRQTGPNQFDFLEVGGITMNKCTNYGPDKLTL